MSLNSAETIIKAAGDVYRAPLETAPPGEGILSDRDALEGLGYIHMGWLHEDGPTPEGFEGEVQSYNGWNRQAPVRSRAVIGEPSVTVPLIQWNRENVQLYFPGSDVDGGTGNIVVPTTPGTASEQVLLIVVQDGDSDFGFWFAKTSPRPGGSFAFPGDEFSQIPVVFDVLAPDDDSLGLAQIIGLSSAEETSE